MHGRHRLRSRALLVAAALPLLGGALASPARAEDVDAAVAARKSPVVLAVEKARPGVVSIRTNEIVQTRYFSWFFNEGPSAPQEREGSLGSGAIFHPAGFVITNAHVIARASKIFVQFSRDGGAKGDEEEREANLVAVDLPNDLAILRMIAKDGAAEAYPYLPLGRSDDLMLGETVLAIGNPFRLGITVSTGIVSALRRTIRPQNAQETEFRDFIQTDAAINPGNSGGPLLDVNGRWIGVTTAILNRSMGAEGIGFAIPADRVREMIGRTFKRRLVNGEWTGFDLEAGRAGAPFVREVYATGPAADAGLRTGDRIVSIEGRPTSSLFDYRLAEVDVPAGQPLRLRVAHDGEREREVDLRPSSASADALTLAKTRFGIMVRDATAADAQTLGVSAQGGVVVTQLIPSGPAERVRMRVNDVLTSVGMFKIRTIDDLLSVLDMIRSGDSVQFTLRRVITNQFGDSAVRDLPGKMIAD